VKAVMFVPSMVEILQMSVHHAVDEKHTTSLMDYQTLHYNKQKPLQLFSNFGLLFSLPSAHCWWWGCSKSPPTGPVPGHVYCFPHVQLMSDHIVPDVV